MKKPNLRERAIRLLTSGEKTRYELQVRLIREGFSEDEVEEVLQWLDGLGYLNDERTAKLHVTNRNRFRPTGRYLVEHELRQKGVDDNIIGEVLNSDKQDYLLALELAQRRYQSMAHLPREKCYHRLGGLLMRRGFSWEVTSKVLREVLPYSLDTDL